jgi:hypothetical protein
VALDCCVRQRKAGAPVSTKNKQMKAAATQRTVQERIWEEAATGQGRPGTGQDDPTSAKEVPMENKRNLMGDIFKKFGTGLKGLVKEPKPEDEPDGASTNVDASAEGTVSHNQTPQGKGVFEDVAVTSDEDDKTSTEDETDKPNKPNEKNEKNREEQEEQE